jgi:O-antigen/teichoic acid export membrane protein
VRPEEARIVRVENEDAQDFYDTSMPPPTVTGQRDRVFTAVRRGARSATVGSLAAAVGSQAFMVVSGIVAARVLGVEDRGQLAFLVLLPVIATHLGLAVPVTATFHIARAPEAAGDVVRRLRRPALSQTVVLLVVEVAVLAVVLSNRDPAVRTAGLVTVPAVALLLAQQYGLAILQGRQAFLPFNVFRVGPAALYAVGVLVAVGLGAGTLLGFAVAWIVATGISALVTCVVAARAVPPPVDDPATPSTRAMMGFGWRALLGTASPIEYFQLDQAIVAFALSARSLGIYVVAVALTNLVRFIGQSIGIVAYPRVAAREGQEQRRTLWNFVLVTAVASGAAVLVLEVCAGWLVPFLFGAGFADAVGITRVLLLSAFLFSLRRVLTEAGRGAGHATAGSVAEVISLVVLAVVGSVLVTTHGTLGLAWALVVSGGVSFCVLALSVSRVRLRRMSALLFDPR